MKTLSYTQPDGSVETVELDRVTRATGMAAQVGTYLCRWWDGNAWCSLPAERIGRGQYRAAQ